jgi:hypothetical protein
MKKIIVLFAFISSVFYVKAQFSTGLSGEFLYPLSKLKERVDFGYGSSLAAGYTFKNNITVSLEYEYIIFNSLIQNYKQQAEYLSVTYNFFDKGVIPYVGLKAGFFQSVQSVVNQELIDNYFGLVPTVGIIFESGLITNLRIKTNFSYTKVFDENGFRFLKFGIGINYYF